MVFISCVFFKKMTSKFIKSVWLANAQKPDISIVLHLVTGGLIKYELCMNFFLDILSWFF